MSVTFHTSCEGLSGLLQHLSVECHWPQQQLPQPKIKKKEDIIDIIYNSVFLS